MVKVHTRIKRKLGISAHRGTRLKKYDKRNKPKTFKSEDLAKIWATNNSIETFELINLRNEFSKSKKIKIIVPNKGNL